MAFILQLKRNSNLYENKESALVALRDQLTSRSIKDGEIIISRYQDGTDIKTVFGISSDKEATGTKYTIFDSEAIPSDVQKMLTDLIGTDPDSDYNTIKKIADALVIINGDASTNGSIEKALADAKADSTSKIEALNVTEQSENGKYVSAISQTNGKINPTLKQVEANEVKLEQIGEVDANGIKLNATTVQEGIAELFTKILDNEEVDAAAINKIKTILGITGEELKYETKSDDTIIGAATSYSDADVKLAEAIRTAQDNAITIQAGNGVNITSNGSEKTINVKVVNDDKLITVDNSGVHTKDNAVFDCGNY